jgi:hypothetical protein
MANMKTCENNFGESLFWETAQSEQKEEKLKQYLKKLHMVSKFKVLKANEAKRNQRCTRNSTQPSKKNSKNKS